MSEEKQKREPIITREISDDEFKEMVAKVKEKSDQKKKQEDELGEITKASFADRFKRKI